MVCTVEDEFIEVYTRNAMKMRKGGEVKVWDPPSQDFREGSVYSRDDEAMYIWLLYENIFLAVPNEDCFFVVLDKEEDNLYIPLVTDILAKRAKAAALAKAD
jgi:hypothetical protein